MKYTKIFLIAFLIPLIAPAGVMGTSALEPYEQEFLITAYYSPLPDQCCYVTGGYESDKVLNGQGRAGADGTAVYPGMLAAPKSYAFGTRIALPGFGNLTVHDRGGAIQELEKGVHRLDIWAGEGEEGLARALAFGIQRVRGTVYPLGTQQPAEQFALSTLPAPTAKLSRYAVDRSNLMALHTQYGETSYSARILQGALKELGYFNHSVTGYFGDTTRGSLVAFLKDFDLDESDATLTANAAAHMQAALKRKGANGPLSGHVDQGSPRTRVAEAQRLLRSFGYYRGRTHGIYDDNLFASIFSFQKKHGLVQSEASVGAGRIGPQTSSALYREWNKGLVTRKASQYLEIHRVEQVLADRGKQVDCYLGKGDSGSQVRLLQSLLADRGFFPSAKINGYFGPLTEQSVFNFQRARGIVQNSSHTGAGYVGPMTLMSLRREQTAQYYQLVRAQGWGVL